MNNCGNCANYNTERMCHTDICGECFVEGQNGHIIGKPSKWKPLPLTNGDRIRAMTDEELAEWVVFQTGYRESACSEVTYYNILTGNDDNREDAEKAMCTWLKQPVEED